MKRRHFLELGLAANAAARIRPAAAPPASPPLPSAPPPEFEFAEATVASIGTAFARGRITAHGLVERYLERIAAIDRRGPTLRSVIELNPDALAIAARLDGERRAGKVRGPLHGIPILIKDNIATGDRMETTAGSLALVGHRPPKDAFIVARLREAGLVLLGKTNLSEWANARSPASTSGWSGRGGQTKNPYVLDRNPCGSSSGSGAAAAANLTALAIGTETSGSIVCPSSANALVGIKPTVGLWSRHAIIPISATQDTAGPMCRTVTDAALLLGALRGVDSADSRTTDSASQATADYVSHLPGATLKGARLGVIRDGLRLGPKTEALYGEMLQALRSAGAELVDPANLPDLEKTAGELEGHVFRFEFKAGVEAYLATLGIGSPKTLRDLIAFNERERDREMPFFGQEELVLAADQGPLTDPVYQVSVGALVPMARKAIDDVLAQHRLDALIAPTGEPAWVTDHVHGDRSTGGTGGASAIAGYPHVTVPAGWIQELPVGLSFMGTAWSEPRLLELAAAFERVTAARKPPRFIASI
jgi:amidase